MRKLLSVSLSTIFMAGSLNATSKSMKNISLQKIPDCGETVCLLIESFENDYGCLEADDYNELYTLLYDHYCA